MGTVYADESSSNGNTSVISDTSPQNAPSIEWFKTYGQAADDDALIVTRTSNGSFIVGGATESSDQTIDASWIKKISNQGNTEWTRNYGPLILDEVRSICELPTGGFLMAGGAELYGEDEPEDAAVIKVDSEGNLIWNMTYGTMDRDDTVRCIIHKKDQSCLAVGKASRENGVGSDAFILSLNPDGTTEWFRIIGDGKAVDAQSVIEGKEGYFIAGYKEVAKGNFDAWVCNVDREGTILWEKTYGGALMDSAHEITSDGEGYVITGEKTSGSAGGSDLWVFKISIDGDLIWEQVYGGPLDEKGYSITPTTDSGFLIAGTTQSYGAGMTDAWIVKLASDGTPEWSKTVGGPDEDIGSYAIETVGNDIISCGMTRSYGAGMYDAMVTELGW